MRQAQQAQRRTHHQALPESDPGCPDGGRQLGIPHRPTGREVRRLRTSTQNCVRSQLGHGTATRVTPPAVRRNPTKHSSARPVPAPNPHHCPAYRWPPREQQSLHRQSAPAGSPTNWYASNPPTVQLNAGHFSEMISRTQAPSHALDRLRRPVGTLSLPGEGGTNRTVDGSRRERPTSCVNDRGGHAVGTLHPSKQIVNSSGAQGWGQSSDEWLVSLGYLPS